MGMPYYSYRKRHGVVPDRSIADAAEGFGSIQGKYFIIEVLPIERKDQREGWSCNRSFRDSVVTLPEYQFTNLCPSSLESIVAPRVSKP